MSEEDKLTEPNVPFKTKKQGHVQESEGFIQELLTSVISSLRFLTF